MYELWLRSFHAVARHGGVTAAAEALGLSQPTLTEQVKALEGRFQVELFHRQGRRISLTNTGRTLYAVTQDIAGHMEEAIRLLEAAGSEPDGPFAIGSANPYYVMELVGAFSKRFPGLAPSVEVRSRHDVIAGLYDFRYDAVMFGRMENDARILNLPYRRERVMVLVPRRHPWTGRKDLRIAELQARDTEMVVEQEVHNAWESYQRASVALDQRASRDAGRPRHSWMTLSGLRPWRR